MKEIRLGKVMVQGFIRTLGESMRSGMKELYATTREGDRSFIAQKCSNARGRFMALVEYGGGGRRNFIFILEDVEGRGWRRLAATLREIILEEKGATHNGGGCLQRLPEVRTSKQNQSYSEALVQSTVSVQSWEQYKGGVFGGRAARSEDKYGSLAH